MEGLTPAFADCLRRLRPRFNAVFALARLGRPALDADRVLAVCRDLLDPLAAALAKVEGMGQGLPGAPLHCARLAFGAASPGSALLRDAPRPAAPAAVRGGNDAHPASCGSDADPGNPFDLAMLELFELAVDLVARGLIGEGARSPTLGRVWREVLPAVAPVLALTPGRVALDLSNAALQIASINGAAAEEWSGVMVGCGPLARHLDELLDVGRVAAWRCGMAHQRERALAAAWRLPPLVVARTLGLAPRSEIPAGERDDSDRFDERMPPALHRLAADPWLSPAAACTPPSRPGTLQLCARVGAWRGFGGEFTRPPRVATVDDRLVAFVRDEAWQLFADHFGAVLRRVGGGATALATDARAVSDSDTVTPDGCISFRGAKTRFPFLAGAASVAVAVAGTTLAVTHRRSHCVYLFAIRA